MKILLTMNLPYCPTHGGANKANVCLSEGLAKHGHEVRALTPALAVPSRFTLAEVRELLKAKGATIDPGADIDYTLNGVHVHAVAEPSRLRLELLEEIRRFQPDVLLMSSEDASQNLLSAAVDVCPERTVYLAHSPSFLPFGPWAFFPSRSRTKLLSRAGAIISVSDFVADYLSKWGGLRSTRIYWPAYGDGPFPKLGSFDNAYVTMINPCAVKGISIFKALAQELPAVAFAAVPTWGTTAEDRATLERLPNVRLLSPSDNIDDIFKQTRVLLVPSLWGEAFGLVVVEAMLRGIPVLASDSGGIIEASLGAGYTLPVHSIERFTDSLDGNMVPAAVIPEQDIRPWRDAVRELTSDRELFERQSSAGREAATRFVSSLSIRPFEELFLQLSDEHRSPWLRSEIETAGPENAPPARPSIDVANLSPEHRALLLTRLRRKANGNAARPVTAIERVARDKHLPASFAQQRLWLAEQLQQGRTAYNISGLLCLRGALDVGALRKSLNEVVRRHEILRTTFRTINNELVQIVSPAANVLLPLDDLRNEFEPRECAIAMANELARQSFDLESGPLLRTNLFRTAEDEHFLFLTIHHIVSDGWSLRLLVQEVSVLYGECKRGLPSSLPELPIQYADFANMQRQWFQSESFTEQAAYWKRQLAGAPVVLELPADRPRPPMQTSHGALEKFSLPAELSHAIVALGRNENATLFMTLLAAFAVLLYRYTAEEHCLIGTNIANRNRADTENLIGLFANNLVLHADLSGNPTFRELLARVRQATLGAYAHQDFPFEKLVELVAPPRDLSRSPLMQVLFVLQNAQPIEFRLADLSVNFVEMACDVAKFDFTLFMEEQGKTLQGAVEYNIDLFNRSTILNLLDHYTSLLEDIVADPDRSIALYGGTGSHLRQLSAFNDSLAAY